MTYEKFQDEVISILSSSLPNSITVIPKTIKKNNDILLHGIILQNNKFNIAPTIYLDYFYEKYQSDPSLTVESITELIIQNFEKNSVKKDFDVTCFTDFKKAKDKITYKLINYNKNIVNLKEIPYIKYLDLAIVFYCIIGKENSYTSSIIIRNEHIDSWGITVEELFEVAKDNTPYILKPEITSMQSFMLELMKDQGITQEDIPSEEEAPMYILTNEEKLYGACCILYDNVLKQFAKEIGQDLILIPSSVHEVLLIPSDASDNMASLSELIVHVNKTSLDAQEILSDHPYYYSLTEDSVSCIA